MHKAHPFYVGSKPKFAGLVIGVTAMAISIIPSMRQLVSYSLQSRPAAAVFAFLLAAFALANYKNLPFVWHVRFLRSFFYQLWWQPHPQRPKYLFAPLVTSYRNTILDCDYNIHKSNSTYFVDLDVAHAHAVGLILRTGLARLNRGDQDGLPENVISAPGRYGLALGGVSCSFHKQIEPLRPFEIYTRLLTWDKKWLYFVSHVMEKGAIIPDKYVLQPGKKTSAAVGDERKQVQDLKPDIFATSIAKYVGKKGRLTLNPEILLEWSCLLPARPDGVGYPPRSNSFTTTRFADSATPTNDSRLTNPKDHTTDAGYKTMRAARNEKASELDGWTWEDMERERLSGLEFANHFDALAGLANDLRTENVLGRFGAYW